MIAIGIVGAFAAVLGLTAWRRITAGRVEQRSMQSYERALGRLGDVAKRSDTGAPVHAPSPEELARPHVSREPVLDWPRARSAEPPLEPRVRLTPPVLPGVAPDRPLVFADEPELLDGRTSPVEVVPERVRRRRTRAPGARRSARDEGVARRPRRSPKPTLPAERARTRHAASGAVAIVALAAIAVGSWQLSAHNGPRRPSASLPTQSGKSHGHVGAQTPPTTQPPDTTTAFVPVATTPLVVTFAAPSGPYAVRFVASRTCWLGVLASPGGKYLWMDTLTAGGATTYQGSGPFVVRIGDPPGLVMTINGEPVDLPSGNVQPYDAVFSASSAGGASD